MKQTDRKPPGARGIPPPFNQPAAQARQFKPRIAQLKSAAPAHSAKRPVAPAVYRPQAKPLIAPTNGAGLLQMKRAPAAPLAYRPQPVPRVLQRRETAALPPNHTIERHPIAPAVYRPQPVPRVLQTKRVQRQPTNNQSRSEFRPPAAPAVYRPQTVPRVLQGKRNLAAGDRPGVLTTADRSATSYRPAPDRSVGAAPPRAGKPNRNLAAIQTKRTPGLLTSRFASVIQLEPLGPPNPSNAKGKTIETTDDQGRLWLSDQDGKRWLLRTSSLGNDYWWPLRKKKAEKGFHMGMRTSKESPTLEKLADQKNMKDILEWYPEDDDMTILVTPASNPKKRDQQGTAMAKFFGAEEVKKANKNNNGSYISASTYAGEEGWEWLHIQGHSIGGFEKPENLVAGSHGANTAMAAIESAVGKFMGTCPFQIRVSAVVEDGFRLGKKSRKALVIFYEVIAFGSSIPFTIDARRDRLTQVEFDQMEEHVSSLLARTTVPVKFLSGGFLDSTDISSNNNFSNNNNNNNNNNSNSSCFSNKNLYSNLCSNNNNNNNNSNSNSSCFSNKDLYSNNNNNNCLSSSSLFPINNSNNNFISNNNSSSKNSMTSTSSTSSQPQIKVTAPIKPTTTTTTNSSTSNNNNNNNHNNNNKSSSSSMDTGQG